MKHTADSPAAQLERGNRMVAAGRLEKALGCFLEGARRHPREAAFQANAATVLFRLGRHSEALKTLNRALRLQPENGAYHHKLGSFLIDLGQADTAIRVLERATVLAPEDAAAWLSLGAACLEAQDSAGAERATQRAVELAPERAEAQSLLGSVHATCGHRAESAAAFRRALELEPKVGLPYYHLARSGGYDDPEAIEALLSRDDLANDDRMRMCFALGYVHERRGDHERAFAAFEAANRLKRVSFDPAANAAFFRRIAEVSGPRFFEARAGWGRADAAPLFVVGLPRSGSSLIEEILSAHPGVHGIGEHERGIAHLARRLRQEVGTRADFPEGLAELAAEQVVELAGRYLGSFDAPPGTLVVDKLLLNFTTLGLIALLFPRARIVHSSRHPFDTCLSAYFIEFHRERTPYAYDLEHLAAHCEHYRELMEHWRRVLPLPLLEVPYEELVGDPEGWSRRLIDFCGLEWDDAVLDFHASERPVFTASHAQVREPVYTRSCGRWRGYERFLGRLRRLAPPSEAA